MSDTIEITNAHHAKLVNEAVALTVACEHIRLLLAVAKKSPEPAGDWDRAAQWVAIDRAERFLRENGT